MVVGRERVLHYLQLLEHLIQVVEEEGQLHLTSSAELVVQVLLLLDIRLL